MTSASTPVQASNHAFGSVIPETLPMFDLAMASSRDRRSKHTVLVNGVRPT
jgi:hypothetical protein